LRHPVAAVFRLNRDELSRVANLPEEIIVAEISHKILTVRGNAERDVCHRFQKKGRMRRAVREVHVKVVDFVLRK